MTAINAGGYGVIYLTPNQLVDFSQGEAVVRFNMSTLRTSARDWVDLWVTPFDDNLQLPLESVYPDLDGVPRRSVHVKMDNQGNGSVFNTSVVRDFRTQDVQSNWFTPYESFLSPSATRRDTFELRLSRTHLKFGMPQYNFSWVDANIADLGWTQGVLQLGHHSYTPDKGDCMQGGCGPDTWHWSDVSINSAVPFTILKADRRFVDASSSPQLNFPAPSPAGAHLRFAAIGTNVQVSFNAGQSWQAARVQPAEAPDNTSTKFQSYWTDMPAGVSSVRLRANNTQYLPWNIRDVTVWAPGASQSADPTPTPEATEPPESTSTPTPTPARTATPTSTPARTATPTRTPVRTATPTLTTGRTATPTPTTQPSSTETVTFADVSDTNQPMNGEYPDGEIDWGNNAWFLSGPYGRFAGNSVSFNGSGQRSASFTFVDPRRPISVRAYNGGDSSSRITLSCAGQPSKQVILPAKQDTTIQTGWANKCSSVTISSSNGWFTNFTNLVIQ
jgi:hypothetical protein